MTDIFDFDDYFLKIVSKEVVLTNPKSLLDGDCYETHFTIMVIVSRKAIHEYASTKPQATEALNEWYLKTKAADWRNLADVKNTFNSVDYVGNDNYVFNIKGNQYRLIARIIFPVRTVFIRFIGTHTDYDKIDASAV